MKTRKFLRAVIAVVIIAVMLAGTVSAVAFEEQADDLKALDLFRGTDIGYELEREPTRTEAAAMLVRLLGKESEAFEKNYAHPFTDVPGWADMYVGYLYEYELTKGMGDNKFGSSGLCSLQMFCTFVLRALGYTEAAGDFEYDDAVDFAYDLELVEVLTFLKYKHEYSINVEETFEEISDDEIDISIELTVEEYKFTRDDCVAIMVNALIANLKGTEIPLIQKLVTEGAVDAMAAIAFAGKYITNDDGGKGEDGESEMSELSGTVVAAITEAVMTGDFVLCFDVIYVVKAGNDYMFETNDMYMYCKDGYIYTVAEDGTKIKFKPRLTTVYFL